MSDAEKIALIKAGISHRHEGYIRVKELQDETVNHIETETGYSRYFIIQCRKIAGWKRRKGDRA